MFLRTHIAASLVAVACALSSTACLGAEDDFDTVAEAEPGEPTADEAALAADTSDDKDGEMTAKAVALTIPTAHPRIWFNADRLARARAYYGRRPFTPPSTIRSADEAIDNALHGLLTGQATSCRRAIDWAKTITFTLDGVASDGARWYGEAVFMAFDWCFSTMTSAEQTLLRDRWNTYIQALNDKPWGGIGMEGNNYYTGYFRNTILWAIASYHENRSRADAFLTYALDIRWVTSLKPYLNTGAKGGAPSEGSAYGRRAFGYLTSPFATLGLLGRDMWSETPYFLETLFWTIYSTTPGPTRVASESGGTTNLYETFSFNEDERWRIRDASYNTAQTSLGSYLAPLIERYSSQPAAGYARRFLDLTGARIENKFVEYVYAEKNAAVPARNLSALPLDYVATGLRTLYTKNRWSPQATAVNVSYGPALNAGHMHRDAGSFQIWRGGEFLSRESVGYAENIPGYANGAAVDVESPVAHNTLLYAGKGSNVRYRAPSNLIRLHSMPKGLYAAADLTPMYDVPADWQHREAEMGNPAAGRTIRETLFIRPLETLVVFDRMESGNSDPNVTKTFVMHFGATPTASGNTLTSIRGSQKLKLTTAVPASTTRRIVDERAGGTYVAGQVRAEIETRGQVVSHFLNVIAASGATEADVTVAVVETATQYKLTLTHPTKGTALVTFNKGIESRGGSFGYAASGVPTSAMTLRTSVQPMTVSASGPVWGQ
jgi:hypothetical protein